MASTANPSLSSCVQCYSCEHWFHHHRSHISRHGNCFHSYHCQGKFCVWLPHVDVHVVEACTNLYTYALSFSLSLSLSLMHTHTHTHTHTVEGVWIFLHQLWVIWPSWWVQSLWRLPQQYCQHHQRPTQCDTWLSLHHQHHPSPVSPTSMEYLLRHGQLLPESQAIPQLNGHWPTAIQWGFE